MDHEILDASVSNSSEALRVLANSGKLCRLCRFSAPARWFGFRTAHFLADERAASAQAVTEALAELAQELKAFHLAERAAAGQRRQGR